MKNIVEFAAWLYVAKVMLPLILGIGFVVAVLFAQFADEVTDREYDGVKLRIRKRK